MEPPVCNLGEVCRFQNGFAFKSKLFTEAGVPVLRISNIQSGSIDLKRIAYTNPDSYKENLDKYLVRDGDLLIAMSGATTGKIGINKTGLEFLLNQRVGKFIPSNKLDQKYLYFYLSTKVEEHLDISAGAAQPNLSTEQIKGMKIPLPKIAEQKRIVAILDKAFADIEKVRANTEQNLKNARELFDSYLQQVFRAKSDDWDKSTLGDIAEISSGGTPLKSNNDFWKGGSIAWYSSGELNSTFTDASKSLITQAGLDGSNAKLFPKGSLLIGMYDTAALKMSILDRDGAFNQAIAGVKPNSKLNLEFVLHSINFIKPELLKLRRGVRQKNLNQSKIKAIPLGLPTLTEQTKIVEDLAVMRTNTLELMNQYSLKLKELDELKKSILQKTFSGELTKEDSEVAA